MLCFELVQLRLGIDAIDIENKDIRNATGCDANICIGNFSPPPTNCIFIGGGRIAPSRDGGSLTARRARKNVHPSFRQRQSGLDHDGTSDRRTDVERTFVARLRVPHTSLPPSSDSHPTHALPPPASLS